MVAHPNPPSMTVEEYLELEENSPTKHEYIDGHVFAMAGGSLDHGAIAANVIALMRPLLRGGPCRLFDSDVKMRLAPRRYVYPDASVTCDSRDLADGRATFINHPRLIVEVLSPSTADYDRGDKFAMYGELASLEEYVLVSAQRREAEVRARAADGTWVSSVYGPEQYRRLRLLRRRRRAVRQ